MTEQNSTSKPPIATIQKNQREEMRFTLDEYKGHRFVTVRIFAPGREGAMVRLDPANRAYEPQRYKPGQVRVQGKLAGLLRRY